MADVFDTFPWPQFEMGSAPASGAADRALAVGTGGRASAEAASGARESYVRPKGCREGAATDTRGACAPQTIAKIDAAAAAGREVRRVRAEALRNLKGGLRVLYRTLEWTHSRPLARPSRAFCFAKFLSPFSKRPKCPDANPLKDAHAALDAAVLAACGFSAKKDWFVQLLALSRQVAAGVERGEPVTPPPASQRMILTHGNF